MLYDHYYVCMMYETMHKVHVKMIFCLFFYFRILKAQALDLHNNNCRAETKKNFPKKAQKT